MVTLYSSDTCQKCKMLKRELNSRNIKYKETQDYSVLDEQDIQSLPVLYVDGFGFMTFERAWTQLKYLEVVYGQSVKQ